QRDALPAPARRPERLHLYEDLARFRRVACEAINETHRSGPRTAQMPDLLELLQRLPVASRIHVADTQPVVGIPASRKQSDSLLTIPDRLRGAPESGHGIAQEQVWSSPCRVQFDGP